MDFWKKASYTNAMLRAMMAGAVVLLAVGLTLVGYNALILGTGLAGAAALLHRWWDAAFGFGTTETSQWMIVLTSGVVFGSLASRPEKQGKY
jgi:hypothetical protein